MKIEDPSLKAALHGEMVPKFLATLDATGKPNVVPIISLDLAPDDDGKLIFGEFLIWKTRENLSADPCVAACVLTEDLDVWTIRGRFSHFADRGDYVDYLNRKDMFRYNAYVGIRRAAVIDIEEVTGTWKLSKLNVAAELLPVKLLAGMLGGNGSLKLPDRVSEKFARMQAIKVLAYLGPRGYPRVVPAFSLVPARGVTLVLGTRIFRGLIRDIPSGARVATSVITMDPVAYQAKGIWRGTRLTPAGVLGRILVEEVYSASPPLSGQPIELQDRKS